MNSPVNSLPNIGPRCEEWLAAIGVHSAEELKQVGAPAAYRELVSKGIVKPHRMLLYAFGGAVSGESCITLSRNQKRKLEKESGM